MNNSPLVEIDAERYQVQIDLIVRLRHHFGLIEQGAAAQFLGTS